MGRTEQFRMKKDWIDTPEGGGVPPRAPLQQPEQVQVRHKSHEQKAFPQMRSEFHEPLNEEVCLVPRADPTLQSLASPPHPLHDREIDHADRTYFGTPSRGGLPPRLARVYKTEGFEPAERMTGPGRLGILDRSRELVA